jgi:4-hydroxybenzoyl-CoA thioesterase
MNNLAFIHRRRVKWGEIDVAGAVDLSTVTRYTMEATEEWFLEKLGSDWNELHMAQKISTPFARVEIDFRRPVKASQNLNILVSVEKLGRSSLVFEVMGQSQADEALCWEAHLTCIFADTQTNKSIPIPDSFRKIIEREMQMLPFLKNPAWSSW